MKSKCTKCGEYAEIAVEYNIGSETDHFGDSLCGSFARRLCQDCYEILIARLEAAVNDGKEC